MSFYQCKSGGTGGGGGIPIPTGKYSYFTNEYFVGDNSSVQLQLPQYAGHAFFIKKGNINFTHFSISSNRPLTVIITKIDSDGITTRLNTYSSVQSVDADIPNEELIEITIGWPSSLATYTISFT